MLHSGYDRSPEGQAIKRERDEKHLKLDYEDDPNHPFRVFNIGMTAHQLGDHEKAIPWVERAIEMSQAGDSTLNKSYVMLAVSRRALGNVEGALAAFAEGIQRFPGIQSFSLNALERFRE